MKSQKLTDALIQELTAEPGKEALFWDVEVMGLAVRIYPSGEKGYWLKCRDGNGRLVRKSLGLVKNVKVRKARSLARAEKANAEKIVASDARKVPTLLEGLKQALELSRASERGKADLMKRAEPFLEWLKKYHPKVKRWSDLRPSHIQAYVVHLEKKNLAFDSIRLRLVLVKSAWATVFRDFPSQVLPLPKVRMPAKPMQEIVCLEPAQVATLLEWLKKWRPHLYGMAALQSLCGLRMLEAAALRFEDVDLKAKTVRVASTSEHDLKNPYSARLIPICTEAAEAVQFWIDKKDETVRSISGPIFTDTKGQAWELVSLSHRWRSALKSMAARPVKVDRGLRGVVTFHSDGIGDPVFKSIPGRKLRASFASMAGRLGARDQILQSYLGHAPTSVLTRHYRRVGFEELKTIAELMDHWRDLVKADAEKGKQTAIGGA